MNLAEKLKNKVYQELKSQLQIISYQIVISTEFRKSKKIIQDMYCTDTTFYIKIYLNYHK